MNPPPSDAPAFSAPSRLSPAIWGWAGFLGASWTWCIGMFLPVLLMRDFGIGGWIVFAVPNILGAAAMGWILAAPEASQRLVARHRRACVWFSIVTILFHLFFAGWFLPRLIGNFGGLIVVGAILLLWAIIRLRPAGGRLAAGIALVISMLALIATLIVGIPPLTPPPVPPAQLGGGLFALAAVCCLGFGLCPYLDLTFHHAKAATGPAEGRWAFGLGFGVIFLAMIVLTACYAGWMILPLHFNGSDIPPALRWMLALHLSVQIAFTVDVHFREISRPQNRLNRPQLIGLIAGALGAIVLSRLAQTDLTWFGRDRGEIVYRCFMGFYGLVFPAYVWICMIPRHRGGETPDGGSASGLFIAAVIIAAPMYWMAFVQGGMIWLIPGVAVVLMARLPRG